MTSSATKAEAIRISKILFVHWLIGDGQLTESIGRGAGMIGASVTTAGRIRRDIEIIFDEGGDVLRKLGIDKVLENSRSSARRPARHVLIKISDYILVRGLVICPDILGPQQATLFTGIPVKLNGVLGFDSRLGKDAKGLKDNNTSGTVILCAGTST